MKLSSFGFSIDTVSFFNGYFTEEKDKIIFPNGEVLFPDGKLNLSPFGTYLIHRSNPSIVKNVIVFHSFVELFSFYQVRKNIAENSLLMVAGYLCEELPAPNPVARFSLAFGNTFFGRVSDIRFSCLIDGALPNILIKDEVLCVEHGKYSASLPLDKLSLSRFCKLSGFRSRTRTIKPKNEPFYYRLINSTIRL
ncbi:MAG: hypothetical protein ACK5M7_09195 [Draconibacterium sp.]